MVSKVKMSLAVALALTVALALMVAPLIIIETVRAIPSLPYLAPDFSMTYLNGTTFSLSSYIAGKIALLEFFRTTCPYCQNETVQLDAIKSHFGDNITMLAVSMLPDDWSSGNGTILSFISSYSVTYTIAEDTYGGVNLTGWGLYQGISGSGTIPQIFIINQTGYVEFANVATATYPPLPASMLEQQLDSLMWDLSVFSAYGSPSPGVGDNFYPGGSSVNCSITSPVTSDNRTVWVCTGWTGTGSVSNGSSPPTPLQNIQSPSKIWANFTITQNSTITWSWASYQNIDNLTAWTMMTSGSFPNLAFIDVRDANEGDYFSNGVGGYDEGHIYGAMLYPQNSNGLQTNITQLTGRKNEPIIVYCHSAHRSDPASAYLVSQGFTQVYNLKDPVAPYVSPWNTSAMQSWVLAGYPYVNASAHLVVQGMDNRIYYQALNGTDWGQQGWNVLPGSTVDSPAAAMLWGNVTNGNDTMHVVVRGSDGSSLWAGYISMNVKATDTTFHGWTELTGATPSAPTLTSNGTVLCLVVRGEDNRIYYRSYIGGSWGSWFAVPTGATPDSPAAAMLDGNLHIVVRGMDGSSLWDIVVALNGSVVRGWMELSGATNARPALASSQDLDELYLAVKGMDNRIYYMIYNGSKDSWGSWSAIPTGATDTGPAVTVAGNEFYTIVQGMDGSSLWLGYSDEGTSTFSGWASLTGATPSSPTLTG